MQNYFLKRFNTTTEQILAVSKLIDNTIDLSEIENQVLPTTEQKLCVSLISKLSGKELTENEINNLSIDNVKKLILQFLNTYTKESLEQMAKEYFEKDKLNDIEEQERLKEEESEFIENTEKEIKQEVEQKEIAQKTNFYNLFKI